MSTLRGLGLPSGGGVVTRCPVRLTVVNGTDRSVLLWPGEGVGEHKLPQDGNRPYLPTDLYTEALQRLSGGRMTNQEPEIKVGRKGDLPLNILDSSPVMSQTSLLYTSWSEKCWLAVATQTKLCCQS